MITQFITIELPLEALRENENGTIDPVFIHQQLLRYGNPLRWAITAVDSVNQTVKIEGIVTN